MVSIVWVPMIASDDEKAAVRAAGLFQDERVTQFYDPNRLSGIAYAQDMFSSEAKQALSSGTTSGLPASWLEALSDRPEKAPLWDIVFFYPAGTTWKEQVPAPATWSKQTCFHEKDSNGATGSFFDKAMAN